MTDEKLTKKQRKALEFRNKSKKDSSGTANEASAEKKKRKREEENSIEVQEEAAEPASQKEGEEEPVQKKKRKTRRGKGGKGKSAGPRFLLFVGNLPYDIIESELQAHFKAANPDIVRIRKDKGIAFLEFNKENSDIQHRMEVALRMHHSVLRDRKINVELTVGGGGNSKDRLEKLKQKNEKMLDERRERMIKERKEQMEKERSKSKSNSNKEEGKVDAERPSNNIHPSRAGLIRQ